MDRWLVREAEAALRTAVDPLVVDVGFGACPVTTVELAGRLRRVCPRCEVVGIDVDPTRVAAAQLGGWGGPGGVGFLRGGFEVPPLARRPVAVRAMNVLRQYPVAEVAPAWARMAARLAPGGVLVEGTCDEDGHRAGWVVLDGAGRVRQLVLACDPRRLSDPAELAERLPRVLIQRNVAGEGIHGFLSALSRGWARASARQVFSAHQRFAAAVAHTRDAGWAVSGSPRRWARGEVAVAWAAVAPGPGTMAG